MYTLIDFSQKQVSPNFKSLEFCYPDYPYNFRKKVQPFFLNNKLITAAQIIRDYFESPVKITSCHRILKSELYHFYYMAIDLQLFSNASQPETKYLCDNLRSEFKTDLYFMLRKCGINGIGLSASHLHLDIREGFFNNVDEIGPYCLFDE